MTLISDALRPKRTGVMGPGGYALAERVDLHNPHRDIQETHNQDARWAVVICNFGGINPHPFDASAPRHGFRTLLF